MKKTIATILFAPLVTNATLNQNVNRSEKIVQLSRGEICVIPQKIAGAKYSKKDIETEQALCNLDISTNSAVCGKTASTNPALEFFALPSGMTAQSIESNNCFIQKPGGNKEDNLLKKLAKYKLSTSCSYTPSLLSYYHLSRFLGNINQVPPVVLRTVERNTHIEKGVKTYSQLKESDGLIYLTWQSLLSFLKAGKNLSKQDKKDGLFTDDFNYSYGALQKNPSNEEKYSELFNGGKDQAERAINFKNQNLTYKRLSSNQDLSSIVSREWNRNNLQEIMKMQNVSDMIILDTILSQGDRFGNLHYTLEGYSLVQENGSYNVKKADKDENDQYPANTLVIKKLMMKDNDCGIIKENHLKNAGLLANMKHLNPETYQRLLKLDEIIRTQEGINYLKTETGMTSSDIQKIALNLSYVIGTLKQGCMSGDIKLDLNLDEHFTGKVIQKSCELIK